MSKKDEDLYYIILSYFDDDGLTEDDVRAYLLDTMKRAEEESNSKRAEKSRAEKRKALRELLDCYSYFLSFYGIEDPDVTNGDLDMMLDTLDELIIPPYRKTTESKSRGVKKNNSDAI